MPNFNSRSGPKVGALDIATDDMWARDSGPIFLKNDAGQRSILDLNFNGRGGKQAHPRDGRVASRIVEALGRPFEMVDIPSAVNVRSRRSDGQ